MNQFVEKYGQILLPLITPYDANEEVDYGKYAELDVYKRQHFTSSMHLPPPTPTRTVQPSDRASAA